MTLPAKEVMLFGVALWGFFVLLGLAASLWWLVRGVRRLRSGEGGRGPVAAAAVLALPTLVLAVGLSYLAFGGLDRLVEIVGRAEAARQRALALVGQPAPDLRFFEVADGRASGLEALSGEVVLVNFWATWCSPCRREMPDLERLQRDLAGRGLRVIHLSTEPRETLLAYLQTSRPANLHVYAERRQWPAALLPTTYAVDRQGTVRGVHVGMGRYDDFAGLVEPHL